MLEVFKVENLMKTLNMTEDIAKGCSLMAAALHPTFRVATYDVNDSNSYPIAVSWAFEESNKMEIEGSNVK